MMGILCLAPELVLQICYEFHGGDLFSVYATCTQLSAFVAPRIFNRVTIDAHLKCAQICETQLQALAAPHARISQHVRVLEIRSLEFMGESEAESRAATPGAVGVQDASCENRGSSPESDAMMKNLLGPAVKSLKNLISASWIVNHNDPQWAIAQTLDGLLGLSSLREFCVTLTQGADLEQLSLHQFRSLTKLVTMNSHDRLHPEIVRSCISNNPDISHLELRSDKKWGDDRKPPALHDFLASNTSPLRLQHLSLWGIKLKLDAATLSHLRSLTSLELSSFRGLYQEYFATNAVWQTLRAEGIYLKVLKTNNITPTLIHYLASYSGLETLHLIDVEQNTWQRSDALAEIFYDWCLPKHACSLKHLLLHGSYEGKWCFNRYSAAQLIRCGRLRELVLPIAWNDSWKDGRSTEPGRSDIRNSDEDLTMFLKQLPSTSQAVSEVVFPDSENPEDVNVIEALIEFTTKFSRLHTVAVQVTYPECLRDSCCGNPYISWDARTDYQVRARIDDSILCNHKQYPRIKFGKHMYRPVWQGENGLKYVVVNE